MIVTRTVVAAGEVASADTTGIVILPNDLSRAEVEPMSRPGI